MFDSDNEYLSRKITENLQDIDAIMNQVNSEYEITKRKHVSLRKDAENIKIDKMSCGSMQIKKNRLLSS